MPLNEKERLFVKEYIINKGNAFQAALNAGYKQHTAKNAYEWLLEILPNPTAKRHLHYKPEVKAAIEAELEKIESEKTADAKEIIEYLTSVLRGESSSEVVVVEGCGDGYSSAVKITKAPDEKERLKAAELLGKILMMFNNKVDVNGILPVMIVGENDLED